MNKERCHLQTSLLLSLMGELQPEEGHITTSGTLGYVSQQSWVFSASVKQNVLFGEPNDPVLYSQVIHVCALNQVRYRNCAGISIKAISNCLSI